MTYYTWFESPIGELLLTSDDRSLTGLFMHDRRNKGEIQPDWVADGNVTPLKETMKQLKEYFRGERQGFDVPISFNGTNFDNKVWKELTRIPYGKTISYGELARRIGNPKASRAVGLANGRNPIGIIVPCHRVIGANGKLTGYGGGLPRKQFLLELEAGPQLRITSGKQLVDSIV